MILCGQMHLDLQKKGISTDTQILAQFNKILTYGDNILHSGFH